MYQFKIYFLFYSRLSKRFKKSGIDGSTHSNSSQKNSKNEKLSSHSAIPFHRQKPVDLSDESFCCTFKSAKHRLNSDPVSLNYSSSNLPQLQTSVSHCKTESLPNTPSDAFYTQASVDPVMPTLSPQPPVIKDENSSHFLQSSQNNISISGAESPQSISLKLKVSDEVCLKSLYYVLLVISDYNKTFVCACKKNIPIS